MVAESPIKWLYQLNHSPKMGLLGLPAHLLKLQEVDGILFCLEIGRLPCPLITPLINVHSKEKPVIYTKCIVLNRCSVLLYPAHTPLEFSQYLKEKTRSLYYGIQS